VSGHHKVHPQPAEYQCRRVPHSGRCGKVLAIGQAVTFEIELVRYLGLQSIYEI
jgi:hypothetical protein